MNWFGEIPAHWAALPLKYRYEVQLGKMLDSARIKGDHSAPYLRNVDVQWGNINLEGLPVMDFDDADREKFSLREGDLLVCEGGEIGRCAIWSGGLSECYYQKALHRLRAFNPEADEPQWLSFLMQAACQVGLFNADGNSSTIEHLPAEKLRQYHFPFPPIQEQRAIVKHLGSEISRIDELRSEKEKFLTLLDEKRAALIAQAVTRGLI